MTIFRICMMEIDAMILIISVWWKYWANFPTGHGGAICRDFFFNAL